MIEFKEGIENIYFSDNDFFYYKYNFSGKLKYYYLRSRELLLVLYDKRRVSIDYL